MDSSTRADDRARPRDGQGRYALKLTEEVAQKITDALRGGAPNEVAASYAGITKQTYYTWVRRGRTAQGLPPEERTEEDERLVAFIEAVDQSVGQWGVGAAATLTRLGNEGDSRALMFALERRFPEQYGRRTLVEHGNAGGEPFRVAATPLFDPGKLTDDELDTLAGLLEKARPEGLPGATQRALGGVA